VVRWARLPEDTARAAEVRLARTRASEAGLAALPGAAAALGVPDDVVQRLRVEYEEHAATVATTGRPEDVEADHRRDVERRLRLELLQHKRDAATQLRDEASIDDIVPRELQSSLDLEEVRLLGPAPEDRAGPQD